MNQSIDAKRAGLMEKLSAGHWELDDLPLVRDDSTIWESVQKTCNLSVQELSRLKNIRCPVPGKLLMHHPISI